MVRLAELTWHAFQTLNRELAAGLVHQEHRAGVLESDDLARRACTALRVSAQENQVREEQIALRKAFGSDRVEPAQHLALQLLNYAERYAGVVQPMGS